MKREILGLVLCGGESRRMGKDKALLRIRPGLTQLEYTVSLLSAFCSRVAVGVGKNGLRGFDGMSVSEVLDADGFEGPMAGIVAALRASCGWPVLAIACDMPYLDEPMILQLVNRRNPDCLASGFLSEDGLPEPLCTIYESGLLPLLEEAGMAKRFGLRGLLRHVSYEGIALDRPELLASVNDVEALDRAVRSLGSLES